MTRACGVTALWALLTWCTAAFAAAGHWLNGRVVAITDGDTAVIETADSRSLRVRFYGVDAPERQNRDWPAQAFSTAARDFTNKMLEKRTVSVRLTGERTYAREVGEIFSDGRSVSRELLRAGLAWWNRRYAPADLDLARLEAQARTARRGLWRDAKPVPPWVHRQRFRGAH